MMVIVLMVLGIACLVLGDFIAQRADKGPVQTFARTIKHGLASIGCTAGAFGLLAVASMAYSSAPTEVPPAPVITEGANAIGQRYLLVVEAGVNLMPLWVVVLTLASMLLGVLSVLYAAARWIIKKRQPWLAIPAVVVGAGMAVACVLSSEWIISCYSAQQLIN